MLLAADNPVTWTTPTIVVSILAPIVALVGVVLSNWWSARTTREAEDKRAVNSIAAENLRAASAINAEDRRHENAQVQASSAWIRGAKARAYFGVIASTTRVINAATNLVWFLRPVEGHLDEGGNPAYAPTHGDSVGEQVDEWNAGNSETLRWQAEIHAVGDPEIANLAGKVASCAASVMDRAFDEVERADAATMYDHKRLARNRRRKMRRLHRQMIALIRDDLGAEPTRVDPASQSLGVLAVPNQIGGPSSGHAN